MLSNEFEISYAPKDENRISNLEKEIDKEDLNSISDIEESSVSFKTIYIYESEENIEVKVFIINSTKQNVNFDYLPLIIVNKDKEVVVSEYLKLVEVGEIPTMNIRPYSIFFSKNSLVHYKTIDEDCTLQIQSDKIAAKVSNKTFLDYIDEKISLYDRRIIEKYIENMAPVMNDSFKVNPYKSSIDEEGNKYSLLILSNGTEKDVQLTDMNLIYKNKNDEIQASKKIESLPLIKGNSTAVIKVIIEKEDVIEENFDPEECKLTFA
ncbi:SLAP domain-containing protein [Clostridium grantii]|uniref:SLAP domain-containing protein n=1 Tax=Clostridium grantii DSM 8605 TaxID=1121316 RepID=A0A1M5RLU7_9CLOT|nr:SLAP domain-containing protein [Clostridium grantii]SHH27096.1 SLAP domain-containing protein [Clostridium grantii DSM 8605]